MREPRSLYLIQPNFRLPVSSPDEEVEGFYYLPNSVGTLWAYISNQDDLKERFVLKGIQFKREPLSRALERIGRPAVAGFSCYTWNWEYNLELARRLKDRHRAVLIVFGGPNVPDAGGKFLTENPFVDITVHGEGEHTFADILRTALEVEPDWSTIDGIAFRQGDTIAHTRPRERIENLEQMSNPYSSGIFDGLLADHPRIRWNATVETNRGCPYRCTFCDWGSLTYSKVKTFDFEEVLCSLEWCARNKVDYIEIADANFGAFKKRDSRFVDHVVYLRQKYGFPNVISPAWTKNPRPIVVDMMRKLVDAGLSRGLTLSVQSMTPSVLDAIKRRNMGNDYLRQMLDLCGKKQIPSYTETIIGLPKETKESWKQGMCELLELGQHTSIDVWICQILENAELGHSETRKQYGIKTVTTIKYEGINDPDEDVPETAEMVRATKSMPFDDLIEAYLFSWCVINFHCYGWTQAYARFVRNTTGVMFREFYDRLFDHIRTRNKGLLFAEYAETRGLIRDFLTTGAIDGTKTHTAIGKNILFNSQRNLHIESETTRREMAEFLNDLKWLPAAEHRDVIAFQDAFATDFRRDHPFAATFGINVFEAAFRGATVKRKPHKYEFSLFETIVNAEDYLEKLYTRRNVGWGKAIVRPFSLDGSALAVD